MHAMDDYVAHAAFARKNACVCVHGCGAVATGFETEQGTNKAVIFYSLHVPVHLLPPDDARIHRLLALIISIWVTLNSLENSSRIVAQKAFME